MQTQTGCTEEEPLSLIWGLDPIFSAFARLYIRDILQMKESCQVPGIYFYKSHPVFKVDVLGTVVYKREREDFFCYGVDDSTGVINCLCWKDEKWREYTDAVNSRTKSQPNTQGGFNPTEALKNLQQAQRTCSHLEIGDLLRVRGHVKTSRQLREIKASTYYKVKDPVLAVQISWMMEVPQLYRKLYDKPFKFPNSAEDEMDANGALPFPALIQRASQVLKDLLREEGVERFRPKDVQHHLLPLVSCFPRNTSTQRETEVAQSSSKLLKETVKQLQEEGLAFRKVISQDEVYHVTENDKELHRVTKSIIREDCRREKYAERGCHVLHILSCVRQSYSLNVSKAVIDVVLKSLECNSEIISTTDSYYTVL